MVYDYSVNRLRHSLNDDEVLLRAELLLKRWIGRYMVTILIRSKNEERYIGQALEKIFAQNFKDFEVIVVDSGSTDKTLEIARRFNVRILEINASEFSYGYALNLGIRNAKGEIVVNLSAHAMPVDNNWLENLVKHLDNPEVAGVYGRQLPNFGCNPIEKRCLYETYGDDKKMQTNGAGFSNSNSAIKRKVWEKISFDEKMSFAEDIHWNKQVLDSGYRIVYEPGAGVYHSHNHSLAQIYLREINRHKGRLQRKNGFSFKDLIYYYLIEFKRDIYFCMRNSEHVKWFFFIPFYHLILLYGRCKACMGIRYD